MNRILLVSIWGLMFCFSCEQGVDTLTKETTESYYTEPHRPQFHFSPDSMWMNDPNGMVYHDGEYHLFYQYYPDSTVWGPMHWGHAISRDLVKWEHLPIALYPDTLGYIFSGSAVMDHENSSGLGENGEGPMIAIFTHHNIEGERAQRDDYQYQSIAFSNDNGRTWEKYQGNPVVSNPGIKDFRDPKVIWDQAISQWVMVFAAYDKALFYTSSNLKDWKKTGEFGIQGDTRLWECPDLFPIKVEETGEEKWVLIVSIQKDAPNGGTATSYFVGDFNGSTFIGNQSNLKWLDYGTDNYALVTWSDVPPEDGRRLAIGWMSNWQYAQVVPTEKWRSAMTMSRTLTLHKEGEDYLLRSLPVKEYASIEDEETTLEPGLIEAGETIQIENENTILKLALNFKKPKNGKLRIKFSNDLGEFVALGFDADMNKYFIDRRSSGKEEFSDVFLAYHEGEVTYIHNEVSMIIYLDHSSIELFADAGRCVMTDIFFPSKPYTNIAIESETNDVELISGSLANLNSIWK